MKLFLFILILQAATAVATQDGNFGLGGTTTGRVNGVTADSSIPFPGLYNPALLADIEKSRFAFSTTLSHTSFQPLEKVKKDSSQFRTLEGRDNTGTVDLPTSNVSLWAAGFSYPFNLPWNLNRRAGLGIVLSGPYSKLRSFSAGSPYDFSLLRYGTSDSQFKGTVSFGTEIIPRRLFIGLGSSLFITSGGSADAQILADNPTARLNFDVGLNTALLAGVYARLTEDFPKITVGLNYREAISPVFEQLLEGSVQVAKGTETVVVPVALKSILYYEPHTFDFDVQTETKFAKFSAGVAFQLWSAYQPSYIQVSTRTRAGSNVVTQVPPPVLQNTWNPRVSVESFLIPDKLSVAAGYQYRPTPVSDLSGATNLVDTAAHVIGVSLAYRFRENGVIPFPLQVGVYGQWHRLNSRRADKTASNFIGAPGYTISGNSYIYGISLETSL